MLLGLPANVVVVWVSLKYRKTLAASNILITNLAIADILFLGNVPFKIQGHRKEEVELTFKGVAQAWSFTCI